MEPSVISAQAYDATNILLSKLKSHDVETREDLKNALTHLEDFHGVTGTISFDEKGNAVKTPFMVQIKKGKFQQIN